MKVLHASRFVVIVLREGLENWLTSYNRDRGKFRRVRGTLRYHRVGSAVFRLSLLDSTSMGGVLPLAANP